MRKFSILQILTSLLTWAVIFQGATCLDKSHAAAGGGNSTVYDSTVIFRDITTGNASTTKHGYLRKLSGSSSDVLRGDGTWGSGAAGVNTIYSSDGSLDEDRVLNGAGFDLTFSNLTSMTYDLNPSGDSIALIKNQGTNVLSIGVDGSILMGPFAEVDYGRYPGIVSTFRGDNNLVIGSSNGGDSVNLGYFASTLDGSLFTYQLYSSVGGVTRTVSISSGSNTNEPQFKIVQDRDLISFKPLAASGTLARFDTFVTRSSGNLIEVANSNTNVLIVDHLGNVTATSYNITNTITFALSDMTTALGAGTNKNYWYAPAAGMTVKWVRATLATASSSGTPTFDINEAGTTILSTKITVDANEWDSDTAAAAPVISDAAIAARAKIDFDIDTAGTAAAGAQIQIGYTVP